MTAQSLNMCGRLCLVGDWTCPCTLGFGLTVDRRLCRSDFLERLSRLASESDDVHLTRETPWNNSCCTRLARGDSLLAAVKPCRRKALRFDLANFPAVQSSEIVMYNHSYSSTSV